MPDTAITPEHERYLWLRDGKSIHGGWCGSAPFVMSPARSRLYAIAKLKADALDTEIDADILHNRVHELYVSNELVERGLVPIGADGNPVEWNSDEYSEALYKLAQQVLGWSDERFKKANEFK